MQRLYDIQYESGKTDLPAELTVDLEQFIWSIDISKGMGNLNNKIKRVIKEITSCYPTSCKIEEIQLPKHEMPA
ncbi:hypothetical protein EBR43_13050 [bacterium]|nr:hypothetical protein [bacterium]